MDQKMSNLIGPWSWTEAIWGTITKDYAVIVACIAIVGAAVSAFRFLTRSPQVLFGIESRGAISGDPIPLTVKVVNDGSLSISKGEFTWERQSATTMLPAAQPFYLLPNDAIRIEFLVNPIDIVFRSSDGSDSVLGVLLLEYTSRWITRRTGKMLAVHQRQTSGDIPDFDLLPLPVGVRFPTVAKFQDILGTATRQQQKQDQRLADLYAQWLSDSKLLLNESGINMLAGSDTQLEDRLLNELNTRGWETRWANDAHEPELVAEKCWLPSSTMRIRIRAATRLEATILVLAAGIQEDLARQA